MRYIVHILKMSLFLNWVVCFETGWEGVVHYLDDFIFIGPHGTNICSSTSSQKKCVSISFYGVLLEFWLPVSQFDKIRSLIAIFLILLLTPCLDFRFLSCQCGPSGSGLPGTFLGPELIEAVRVSGIRSPRILGRTMSLPGANG